ncbi:hypothetical protein Emtol_3274 [Emticicia oligotrophica DSM 17448]|uniref:Uncharacterized protein n=1 Tax=Emticicia oligotrophica (strain DSM 17448 / CIP 109782 / MTCC 6937 / GPTSA100-15) TaxID=929562 RepID=A0ABM5N4N2_EMTOG|nr:hypothetical protein Emtol_3274 [Emticicia oligotrophica DSM 17448]
MFLEIYTSINHLFMIYPIQLLIVGVLLALGFYELFYFLGLEKFFGIGRNFGHRKYIK